MKKKISLSVEFETPTRKKWQTVTASVANLHTLKKELLVFIETNLLSGGPRDHVKPLNFRLIVNEKPWTLPPFEFVNMYDQKFSDKTSDLFREIERVIDLHDAFYED